MLRHDRSDDPSWSEQIEVVEEEEEEEVSSCS